MPPVVPIHLDLSREEILSAARIADILQVERSTATLYMRRGLIPARKLGRLWYSPQPLLDEFLTELFEPPLGRTLRFSRDELLTPSGVATLLHVQRATAMSYMRRRSVPAEKIGRRWYSPRGMLDEYLATVFDLGRVVPTQR